MTDSKLNQDLDALLEGREPWPGLEPDPAAMARTEFLMVRRLAALKSQPHDEFGEQHFNALSALLATLAVVGYFSWPYVMDFLGRYPVLAKACVFFSALLLLTPLLLLHLLRSSSEPSLREPKSW